VAERVEASPSALSLQGELEVTVLFSDMWLPAHPGADRHHPPRWLRPTGHPVASPAAPAGCRSCTWATQEANAAICDAADRAGDVCVDVDRAYKQASPGGNPTRLLAPDGDHPNQAGHDLIAATVAAAGYAPLS
jgi:lysophospholipase L1-like esterase